jgi:muramoyltetrapeptide carboxypeptidase
VAGIADGLRRLEDIEALCLLIDQLRCGHAGGRQARQFGGTQVAGPRVEELAAQVTGGNLATIVSVLGSPWELDCAGKILLLEDVGEAYYRIERMLLQLQVTGKLQDLAAVGLGEFFNCPRREVVHGIEDIFAEYLSPLGIPLFTGLPFGHGLVNRPWRMHETAVLRADGLTLQPPAAECEDE